VIFGTSENNPIGVSADENTVVITDIWHLDNSFPQGSTGALYLYHKGVSEEWTSASTPLLIAPPEVDVDDFGGGGILFQGNRMATFTRFAPTGNGRIYVYKDGIGEFDNPVLEAKLSAGDLTYSYGFSFNNFAFTPDGIFLMASVDVSTPNPKYHVAFFEQPQSGAWNDGYLTCHFDPDLDTDAANWEPTLFESSGTDLIISSRNNNDKGTLTYLRKGINGWCDPVRETIEMNPANPSTPQRYGQRLAVNTNGDLILGFVAHPSTGVTQVALKTFAKVSDHWEPDYIFTLKKSTAGHYFGRKVFGIGDDLFVSAPYDGSVKASAGAVYVYTKSGTSWSKSGKILPPAGGKYDDVFASNMAAAGDYLTVAAAGHSPNGKFFVYKKQGSWSNPELVQEIDLASNGFAVNVSGDNVAMTEEWLVMPYMDSPSSPSQVFLALYKFNGTTFEFAQSLYVRPTDFFARSSTVPVSIEGNLIVAGSTIIELNESGVWEVRYELSPSDPEPMQISPDFTHWISNGSRFGFSNWISNGTIFISAPTRDYEGIWDVGAVYVYAKLADEPWSSRTESAKVVPHFKEPSGLFGYSLAALQNTLIVGSPLSDFDKNGVAINKPGKASVFQAKDYFWKQTDWLADLTGDSFVKDYFGFAVHLDETDFFMGAPIEDLESGKVSGSVYMVPTPPIVKLVPPVCFSSTPFELDGYPFNGTWTGPGITSASEGIFSPTLAGPGVHILTYQTAGCANPGKLQIEVKEGPIEDFLEGEEYLVCENISPLNVPITIEQETGVDYAWYYREDDTQIFHYEGTATTGFVATKRGEYRVKATNGVCSIFSPIISIKNEEVNLVLNDPPPSCNNSTERVPLVGTPGGGTWTGEGVSNNQFVPLNKAAGTYPLTYNYTSDNGCTYTKAVTAAVIVPFSPALTKSGNVCVDGMATVQLVTAPDASTSTLWYVKDADALDYAEVQQDGNSLTTNRNGSVKVVTQTTYCNAKEASIDIHDSFTLKVLPNEPSFSVCADEELLLTLSSSYPGSTTEWSFYEESVDNAAILNTTADQLRPEQTGYYFATVYLNTCKAVSGTKHVTIHPADTVFIPNVLTPNGDGKNETFKIISDDPSSSFKIFNRQGMEIYDGHGNSAWNGGNAPDGVYYWIAWVSKCNGRKTTYKGFVHLLH
jgi:hypothetical protein